MTSWVDLNVRRILKFKTKMQKRRGKRNNVYASRKLYAIVYKEVLCGQCIKTLQDDFNHTQNTEHNLGK